MKSYFFHRLCTLVNYMHHYFFGEMFYFIFFKFKGIHTVSNYRFTGLFIFAVVLFYCIRADVLY